jgi:hypothetical protein
MSLTQPRTLFGVHSVSPYNPTTGIPYGMARVVQGSTFSMTGDTIELMGGSNRFSWKIEDGDTKAELAFGVSEYPNWLFELFGGKAPTVGSAETTGNVGALTNLNGSSVMNATTGIASVSLTSADSADLKFGRYIVKATGAASFKVYCVSNVDFGRGTSADFSDDTLLIHTEAALTTGEVVVVGSGEFGLTLTGGSGTIGFTSGDTAYFDVRPINTYNRSVVIGGIADTFPEFGCFIYSQKSGSGAIAEINVYRMKSIGLTLGAERKQFGKSDYKAKAYYDSVKNGVCAYKEIE